MRYDVTQILAAGYQWELDLWDDGGFEIDEITIEDGRADLHGTYIDPDGNRHEDAILTIYSVRDPATGEVREVRDLYDVFKAGWEHWDV